MSDDVKYLEKEGGTDALGRRSHDFKNVEVQVKVGCFCSSLRPGCMVWCNNSHQPLQARPWSQGRAAYAERMGHQQPRVYRTVCGAFAVCRLPFAAVSAVIAVLEDSEDKMLLEIGSKCARIARCATAQGAGVACTVRVVSGWMCDGWQGRASRVTVPTAAHRYHSPVYP